MSVRVQGLTVAFRGGVLRRRATVLDRIDLSVNEGDFFALLGQNGAGKTTAMHCMLGLLRPTAGRVEVLGQPVAPGASLFARVGYLPEEPRYHEYLTVEEAVTYYARLSGIRTPAARVASMLERLGLAEHRSLTIRRCSKGMKQKVGIAQCLIHEPRLLFLDEPMRGLDPMTVHLFRDLLLEMNRAGVTIVMSSHLLNEVELVATRAAIIERGRVLAQDRLASLVAHEGSRYVVEMDSTADVPAQLADIVRVDGRIRGVVPAEDFYPFMESARSQRLRIVSCSLEKQTLEDRFVSLVRGGISHV